MRNIIWSAVVVISLVFAVNSMAKDGAEIYKQCAVCHGAKGQGTKGMAPPHKGNKFVIESKPEDLKKLVLEGRAGAAKRYKELPLDMPKSGLSEADAETVVKYIQNDIQK